MNANSDPSPNTEEGIYVDYVSDVRIFENTIENNDGYGISVGNAANVTIGATTYGAKNLIAKNDIGVLFYKSHGIKIEGNTITNNDSAGIWAATLTGSGAVIDDNLINSNGSSGIYVTTLSGTCRFTVTKSRAIRPMGLTCTKRQTSQSVGPRPPRAT